MKASGLIYGGVELKEYKCVMTKGFPKTGENPIEFTGVTSVIEDYEQKGWHLNTYQVSFVADGSVTYHGGFYHHFLFEKEKTT